MTDRVMTHIRLGIRSVSPSGQSPRCPHEETLGPCLSIAKCRGVSPQNVAEFLRELSRNFSAKFCGDNPRRNKLFLCFSAKTFISRKGCFEAKREKKELFSWADLYIAPGQGQTAPRGQNFDVNRKALSLLSSVASFKSQTTIISDKSIVLPFSHTKA